MNHMAKMYQTEEELLNSVGMDLDASVITGVEFNPSERTITYTIRTLNSVDNVTGKISEGEVRRVKLNN